MQLLVVFCVFHCFWLELCIHIKRPCSFLNHLTLHSGCAHVHAVICCNSSRCKRLYAPRLNVFVPFHPGNYPFYLFMFHRLYKNQKSEAIETIHLFKAYL